MFQSNVQKRLYQQSAWKNKNIHHGSTTLMEGTSNHSFVGIFTFIAHFPPLEVEHCVVVGMEGQIELHRQNSLSIDLARTEEVHSKDWTHTTNIIKIHILI